MRLESGPAAYDRNYYIVFLLCCVGLGGYFLYDYKIGYPGKNRSVGRQELGKLGFEAAEIETALRAGLTNTAFEGLAKSRPVLPEEVHQKLGQPTKVVREGEETVEYFASAYGIGRVSIVGGQVRDMRWTTWYKSKDEIRLQLWCALGALVFALYAAFRVYRAATLRAVIDAEGMTYGGRRIRFEDMKRLCDYSRKGWVDLYYQDGSRERRLRIDNQKIRKFHEIIDALCAAKGFEDPRPAAESAASGGGAAQGGEAGGGGEDTGKS